MRLGGPRQFGVDSERVPALLRQLASTGVEFLDFIFSPGHNWGRHPGEAQRKTVALALRSRTPMPVHCLNIGGGLGIPY
jgi:diaminopimelate decarboxylase